jgi:hypothetical protein
MAADAQVIGLAEAQFTRGHGNGIRTHLHGQGHEVDVAGVLDRIAQRLHPVGRMAGKPAAQIEAACTDDPPFRVRPAPKGCQTDDRLERRSRCKRPRQRLVQQGPPLIVRQSAIGA